MNENQDGFYMPLSSLTVSEKDCNEHRTSATGTKLLSGAGAVRDFGVALQSLVPPLSVVLMLSDEIVRNATERFFEKAIVRLGYRVRTHTFRTSPAATVQQAAAVQIPEDTRLIVGVGGGTICDLAKFTAALKNLPCIHIATSPACTGALVPAATIESDGLEETFQTPSPAVVLCDTDYFKNLPVQLVPSAFGELASKAVSLFDYRFAACVGGEKFSLQRYKEAAAVLDETLKNIRNAVGNSVAPILAEGTLRYAALCAAMGNSRLLGGGEVQLAHTLRLLYRHENRPVRLRGEMEMLCARTAIKLYQSALAKPTHAFVPPPDNNQRLSNAVEYLGLSERAVMRKIRPLPSAQAMRLCAYRLGEYRTELVREADCAAARVSAAFGIFKRLYPDDGYAITRYIESSDIPLAVALAPDLKEKYTMLSYLKDTGLLDLFTHI